MLTDELDKHPGLDTTEAIIQIMSNSILNTLANTQPEDWQKIGVDKLLREANSLVKVTAYKRSRRDPARRRCRMLMPSCSKPWQGRTPDCMSKSGAS